MRCTSTAFTYSCTATTLNVLKAFLAEPLPPGAVAVARLGGDEFVVLVLEGETAVRRVLERLAAKLPATPSGLLPFAAGIVETRSGAPLPRAFALADAAMYRQKEAQWERRSVPGRYCLRVWPP
jgi:GGDEF domain-containing protein